MTSPSSDNNPTDFATAKKRGAIDALGIPAYSIFANMTGFSAIAREAGFDINQAMVTTALVWGMPGQVAMASLHMAGASAMVIFTAVAEFPSVRSRCPGLVPRVLLHLRPAWLKRSVCC